MGQHPGLPTARARQNENGTIARFYRHSLLLIQSIKNDHLSAVCLLSRVRQLGGRFHCPIALSQSRAQPRPDLVAGSAIIVGIGGLGQSAVNRFHDRRHGRDCCNGAAGFVPEYGGQKRFDSRNGLC